MAAAEDEDGWRLLHMRLGGRHWCGNDSGRGGALGEVLGIFLQQIIFIELTMDKG